MQITCSACPRKCNAVRTDAYGEGFCKAPFLPKIARAGLHFWEEPCISGKTGSGTVFFSGCNLGCAYCQNFEISRRCFGETVTYERLAEIMRELESKGAENINFVTPSHYVHAIKEALAIYKPKIPLVYNGSGYENADFIKENIFDIYLLDLKYLSGDRSEKYSSAPDYPKVAANVIKTAYSLTGKPVFGDNGMMKRGLIVRHLILPQGTKEAISVIDWYAENTPEAYLSLMAQYLPAGNAANYPEINRRITKREYDKVVDYAIGKGLENVYIQQLSSSKEEYIPPFNLEGVKK